MFVRIAGLTLFLVCTSACAARVPHEVHETPAPAVPLVAFMPAQVLPAATAPATAEPATAEPATAEPVVAEPASPALQPLLVAHPNVLFRERATQTLWRAFVDEKHERAFVERTGVDPRTLTELVAREDGAGYLVLARGPFDAADVVRRAGARLALPDVVTDTPRIRREGLAGQGRYAFAVLAPDTVLVAKDVPPQRVAAVFALVDAAEPPSSTLPSAPSDSAPAPSAPAPSALADEPARSLAHRHEAAPMAIFMPTPLALGPRAGLALLLAEERALAATMRPVGAMLELTVELRGEFPKGADDNFRILGRSMADQELIRMIGADTLFRSLQVAQSADAIVLSGSVPAADVADGLRALFFAETRALFD